MSQWCRRLGRSASSMALVIGLAGPAAAGGLSFVESETGGSAAVAVSADGMNVYVPSPPGLLVFTRDTNTGEITLLETQAQGVGGVDGLRNSDGVAVTPDGNCVYATSERDDKVAVFSRSNVDGALTFLGVKEEGVGGVTGLLSPVGIVVSPDDFHVYVGAVQSTPGPNRSSVVAFSRTPPGCALDYSEAEIGDSDGLGTVSAPPIAIAADGLDVYAGGRILIGNVHHGTVSALSRDSITGQLYLAQRQIDSVDGVRLLAPKVRAVTVSPDGTSVYATSSGDNSIVVFGREFDGLLEFVEAQKDGGVNDGLNGARGAVVSPDGAYVYVAATGESAVSVFRRSSGTGRLRFLEVHEASDIDPTDPLLGVRTAALSPAGDYLYVVSGRGITVFAVDVCGNGARGPDEQCDDGNVTVGDGCSPTCRLELCGTAPAAGCRGTAVLGAAIKIRNVSPDTHDQLQWKWRKGEATAYAEFGDPTTSASYVLCVYDGSANPQPLLASAAPAGGTCKNGAPCWTTDGEKYKYKDALLTPDGLQQVQLKEGLENGQAAIQVKAKGINVLPPALPLTLPVTVQVKNTDNGVCWEAVYTNASTNDSVQFKAKGD